jgi:hypothetical protein
MSTYLKVLAVEYAPKEVIDYLIDRARSSGIYLITGRKY